ncbi:MAG: isochorismatase family protein [Planctomycetota bacterium]
MTDRILLDIETQRDFFLPGGRCYTKQAGKARARIYDLFAWVRAEDVPVISTVLRVRPGELGPLCRKPHCIDGTEGEQKVPRTILRSHVDFGLRNSTDLPEDILETHQQVIFEKRNTDLFAHARAERLITELGPRKWIICGAGLAQGIFEAAVGLRSRGHDVQLASDAVAHLKDAQAEMAIRRMIAKDVEIVQTDEIIAQAREDARKRRAERRRRRLQESRKVPA